MLGPERITLSFYYLNYGIWNRAVENGLSHTPIESKTLVLIA